MSLAELMAAQSRATIVGFVTEKRPLKKDGGKGEVWAYLVKVSSMGATFEVTTRDEKKFNAVPDGAFVVLQCGFEQFNQNLKLTLGWIDEESAAKLTGTPVTPVAPVAGKVPAAKSA